jgi:hypothetical protein
MPPVRPLAEFHRDARYAGDLHRADLAWARHAAEMGLSAKEIRASIMEARDLTKKGSDRGQSEYAERRRNATQAERVGRYALRGATGTR